MESSSGNCAMCAYSPPIISSVCFQNFIRYDILFPFFSTSSFFPLFVTFVGVSFCEVADTTGVEVGDDEAIEGAVVVLSAADVAAVVTAGVFWDELTVGGNNFPLSAASDSTWKM